MKALFSGRGKQKCSLQLYPCLMLIDPVPHFASAPWNLRGIENVSGPPLLWKYPLFSYLPQNITCNQYITPPAEGAFHLFILPFAPHNFWHEIAWAGIAYWAGGAWGKKRKRVAPETHPLTPVTSVCLWVWMRLKWEKGGDFYWMWCEGVVNVIISSVNTILISKSGKKAFGSVLNIITPREKKPNTLLEIKAGKTPSQ